MSQRHFERLPQNGFPNYVGASEEFPWKLRIMVVDADMLHRVWAFETGEMNGHLESIPADFAVVEDSLRKLRSKALPADGKPCTHAPKI